MGTERYGDDDRIEYVFCDDEKKNKEAVSTALDIIMRHGEEGDYSDTS